MTLSIRAAGLLGLLTVLGACRSPAVAETAVARPHQGAPRFDGTGTSATLLIPVAGAMQCVDFEVGRRGDTAVRLTTSTRSGCTTSTLVLEATRQRDDTWLL